METNAAMKFVVPKGGSFTEEMMPDGSRELTINPGIATACDTDCHMRKSFIKKVPASELSLNDDFIKYLPKTRRETKFKEEVIKVINTGVADFWRPVCDPSFDDYDRIFYGSGRMPAVGKSYNWWFKNAKEFCPGYGSRLGTDMEYVVFLAVLIKDLVASGKSMEWAWDVVCNDSKELGHYWNSPAPKQRLEPTARREVCGWYDLANTTKFLVDNGNDNRFWLAAGDYNFQGYDTPLADCAYRDYDYDEDNNFACGWLVFDKCPE